MANVCRQPSRPVLVIDPDGRDNSMPGTSSEKSAAVDSKLTGDAGEDACAMVSQAISGPSWDQLA